MDLARPDQRLAMCRLAVSESELFEVDPLELERAGPSYTLDTARELVRRGYTRVNWLIGGDMLAILPQWHEAEMLIQEVNFIILARPGWEFDWGKLPGEFGRLRENVVTAPRIEISATDIRDRVKRGLSIEYLTPKPVCDYIREEGLYRSSATT